MQVFALTLGDIAKFYLERTAMRYGLEIVKQFNAHDKTTTYELMMDEPETIGNFCSFEQLMPARTASKALRYKLGRASNEDASMVGVIYLRYIQGGKRTKGLVKFDAEYQTYWINGCTGNMVAMQASHITMDGR